MFQIIQKVMINIPVVIQGETGCGKTHLIDFMASCLRGDEFRCFTLHSGVTQFELINRVESYVEQATELEKKHEDYLQTEELIKQAKANNNADLVTELEATLANLEDECFNNLKEKKLFFVLFDEFNTSPHQALIAEIMNERTCSLSRKLRNIPDTIKFIGCCNPYRIDNTNNSNDEDVGLEVERKNQRLSHKVNPICDNLLGCVYDFGQLEETDEVKYIESMTQEAAKNVPLEDINNLAVPETQRKIAKVIQKCQTEVRKIESNSSASLRDVSRFIKVFQFYENWEDIEWQQALVMTCTICYLLRISSNIDRISVEKSIERILNDRNFNFKDFEIVAHRVSEQALKKFGKSGSDISVNKPLKENLIVVLTCITLGIHVLICGKPGTSKTLAVDIAKSILANDLSNDEVLMYFKKAKFSQFYGSMNTTSEGVNKKFLSVTAEYLKVDKTTSENMVLVFDEIGLAELSPDNPNKVLHSYLDPGSEDRLQQLRPFLRTEIMKLEKFKNFEGSQEEKENQIEKLTQLTAKRYVHFVGISNWRLDVSKQNRMIFVARGKMEIEDLTSTCKSIYDSYLKENKKLGLIQELKNYKKGDEMIQQIFKIVSQTFMDFRETQMNWNHDKNLHGSRDFYFLVKYIIHNLKPDMLNHIDNLPQTLCDISVRGIGRNFEGSKSSYKDFIKIFQQKIKDSQFSGKVKIPSELQERVNVIEMIRDNLDSVKAIKETNPFEDVLIDEYIPLPPPPRHIYVRTDESQGAILDNIFIESIKKYAKETKDENGKSRKFKFLSYGLQENEDIEELAAELPAYISQGYILVMKGMDKIYGVLLEILNMRYKKENQKEKSKLIIDDRERMVIIHESFRIIIMQGFKSESESDTDHQFTGEAYAPFQNRLEKYMISLSSLNNGKNIGDSATNFMEKIENNFR